MCLTCSRRSKHFHFSFYFSSSSMLYLIFRKKCALHSMSLNMLGGAYHKWTADPLLHCPAAPRPVVKDTLCLERLHQHQAASITDGYSSKTKPGVCLEDRRWQLHTETTCTIMHFNNSYLEGNESKPKVWFCPGAVSVMKMLPHHNPSKIAILRQNWFKGNVDPWRF